MTPWTSSSRRRHSFMPSNSPADRPSGVPRPDSSDANVPAVTATQELPGRQSTVSLDAQRGKETGKASGMLAVPEESSRSGSSRRFSLLRFRHASDSQLNQTAKQHAQAPPLPPAIMRTAPTQDTLEPGKRRSTFLLGRRPKTPKNQGKTPADSNDTATPRLTFESEDGAASSTELQEPPSYEDSSAAQLAVPVNRASDSSRSDGSSGDGTIYGQTTTVTHTTHTTTTFFKLSRRKKDKGHLFPLPPRSQISSPGTGNTPNLAPTGFGSSQRSSFSFADGASTPTGSPRRSIQHSPSRSTPGTTPALGRSDSKLSAHSTQSGRHGLQVRGRSSTAGSGRRFRWDHDGGPIPPVPHSGRTSTSTAGRPSLGGLFNINRLKQASEPALRNGNSAPGTPMSAESNPFVAAPKSPPVVIPEREEGDTPAKYLQKLEEVFSRSALVPVIAKPDNEFMKNVLRSYMRRFKFFEEPIDMAVRKLLLQIELPKETQQIDRTLQAFADRYHECNPGIFLSPDEAYFIAFSILILHTDVFNKNNKRKMQKQDYLKNTSGQAVAPEILSCFYDNVAYTPFIHLDDDNELVADKPVPKRRKATLKSSSTASLGRQSQPVDPYALILDGKLEVLRVDVDDVVVMDDPFGYLGTAKTLNHTDMRRAFYRSGVIQIMSSRSRPDAFAKEATMHNTAEAQMGVVDIKVTKVGVLWRKDPKKRKTRSPWQEWGAVLTGSQLYLFKNKDWVKSLMHQYDHHLRSGKGRTPCVFKPAIADFRPDFLVSTEGLAALVDSQYRRHKNAFVISRENIFQEVFLADSESELNDWLAKMNYAAAFRTTGVRMRGIGNSGIEPSTVSETASEATPATRPQSDSTAITSEKEAPPPTMTTDREFADKGFAKQIAQKRRQHLREKITNLEDKLIATDQLLDAQLRTARHLSVLTPIQERTRQEILTAAARLAANIRWERMKRWRTRAHRDILHIDLDEDLKHEASGVDPEGEAPVAQNKSKADRSRLGFGRFNSKAGTVPSKASSKDEKSAIGSPTAATKFMGTVEDMFRTPSRTSGSKHQAKGSWELPPLAFDQHDPNHRTPERRDSVATGTTGNTGTPPESTEALEIDAKPLSPLPASPLVEPDLEDALATPTADDVPPPQLDGASLKPPASVSSETRLEDDVVSTTDTELGNPSRPHRHSLQRRLHSNGSGPTFHRHRKHRGSSSTAGASDTDGPSVYATEEGLLRSPGSFTLHGKKASVVTFGSEWQNLSGEDTLRARKAAVGDEPAKLDSNSNGIHAAEDSSSTDFENKLAGVEASPDAEASRSTDSDLAEFQDAPETPEIHVHPDSDDESEDEEAEMHDGERDTTTAKPSE